MTIFERMLSPTGVLREVYGPSELGLKSKSGNKGIANGGIKAQDAQKTEPTTTSGGNYEDNTHYVRSNHDALNISGYYRGVELRSRTMGQLVLQYQRYDVKNGCFITDNYGSNGALNYLLQVSPNPLTTASDMMKQLEIDIITQGNGVIYIDRDGYGNILALYNCVTASYNILDDTYTVIFNTPGGQRSITNVSAHDVLHIRNTYTSDHGLTGMSTLQFMRATLTLDATNLNLQTRTAANGGKVKLLVQEDKDTVQGIISRANPEEIRKSARQLGDEIYQHDVVSMSNISKVTPISMSLTDMDTLNSRNFTVDDISRFLSVPKALLGVTSNSSYKTPDSAMEELLKFAIQPNINNLEQELNRKILSSYDFGKRRIFISDKELRRLDPQAQSTNIKGLIEMGVMTVNEARQEYNQPKVKGGDIVYVSAQWAELGSKKLSDNPTATDSSKNKSGSNTDSEDNNGNTDNNDKSKNQEDEADKEGTSAKGNATKSASVKSATQKEKKGGNT